MAPGLSAHCTRTTDKTAVEEKTLRERLGGMGVGYVMLPATWYFVRTLYLRKGAAVATQWGKLSHWKSQFINSPSMKISC